MAEERVIKSDEAGGCGGGGIMIKPDQPTPRTTIKIE